MAYFRVTRAADGLDFGIFEAGSEGEALTAMMEGGGAREGVASGLIDVTKLARFAVVLDVTALDGDAWDAWCEAEIPTGIDTCGLQPHGASVEADGELWYVAGEDAEAARALAAEGIGDFPVDIRSVKAAPDDEVEAP